jgi:hypothetical protein
MKSALVLVGLLLLASLALAAATSDLGPEPGHTGAPAIGSAPEEVNCGIACHYCLDIGCVTPINQGGQVEILGLPATYTAGQTYPITVRLDSDSTRTIPGRRWGFQITALRASDGDSSGTWLLPYPDTLQIKRGDLAPYLARVYVEHTYLGTRDSLGGPVTWTFSWRAPDVPEGTVLFYCAAVAANGSYEPASAHHLTTPVARNSWGSIKTRYR